MTDKRMRLIDGIAPGPEAIQFTFGGERLAGFEGESIASALLRAGMPKMRKSPRSGQPRSYYCGMGVCWECAVHVDGAGVVRGCMTTLAQGMSVSLADRAIK